MKPRARRVAAAQAAYYAVTAVAPFASRRRFEALTGPKTDWWLVITVGSLVGSIGASLASAARCASVGTETRILGVGAAASLAAVDLFYVARRRISPVYLIDAGIEARLLAGWLRAR